MRPITVLLGALLLVACDSTTEPRVVIRPQPIELTATVNIQLGDTPAGFRPLFIVTGQARATQASRTVGAGIDSVVIHYQVGNSAWLRYGRYSAVPVSGHLPFYVEFAEPYGVWARLYARGFAGNDTIFAVAEWTATGFGY